MKNFFKQTYWFWIVSKIIFALIILISTLSVISTERLKPIELAVNLSCLALAILLIITFFNDFSTSTSAGFLKTISGILMILFGLALITILITISKGSQSDFYFLGYPFALWIGLIGIFEISKVKRKNNEINNDIIDSN